MSKSFNAIYRQKDGSLIMLNKFSSKNKHYSKYFELVGIVDDSVTLESIQNIAEIEEAEE